MPVALYLFWGDYQWTFYAPQMGPREINIALVIKMSMMLLTYPKLLV